MKKIISTLFFIIVISCSSVGVFAEHNAYVSSLDGEAAIYISPSAESYKVMSIPACSEVSILEQAETWALIEYENKTGWINTSWIKSTYEKAAESTGEDSEKFLQVNSDKNMARLYTLPCEDSAEEEESLLVPNGTVLEQTRETRSGWGLVFVDEGYMWIKTENTVEYQIYDDVVVEEKYFVYALSSDGKGIKMWESVKNGKVIDMIPDCTRLAVMDKSGDLIRVAYDGKTGWINSENTEISLYNSQMKAGQELNQTYIVDSGDNESTAKILSIPTDKVDHDDYVEGEVENGAMVFVLRQTPEGWGLVHHDGVTGWISFDYLTKVKHDEDINIYEVSKTGFIATKKSAGLDVYAKYDGDKKVTHIPETVKIDIVAKRGNYNYVICDYASGWAKDVNVVNTREEAVKNNSLSTPTSYDVEKTTQLMSLPAEEKVAGSRSLCAVEKGESVMIQRLVKSENCEWALISYGGEIGWIKTKESPNTAIIIVMISSAVILVFAIVTFFCLRKKKIKVGKLILKLFSRRKKKSSDKKEAGDESGKEPNAPDEENSEIIL